MGYKPVKYQRKETLLVEAMEINKEAEQDVIQWAGKDIVYASPVLEPTEDNPEGSYWQVDTKTSEGVLTCVSGDFIFKNGNGKFYPCAKDIFKDIFFEAFEVVEDEMESYFAVIIKKDSNVKVIRYDISNNINDIRGFFQQLAELYNYEREIKIMQKMFGDFYKCGGILFENCEFRGDIARSKKNQCLKICANRCPRKIPDCEEFLRLYITDAIVIIGAERGEIWRNR
jgi:hypothetical protein